MVDPFSAASGTAGILSLGLTVCGGLIKYCRAWKSHDEDVEEALNNLLDLEVTLKTLKGLLSMVECVDDSNSEKLQLARDRIKSCTANLNKLHTALTSHETISYPAGVLDKVHNVRLRSMNFVNKEKVKSLRRSVKDTRSKLDSAISILQVHVEINQQLLLKTITTANRESLKQLSETYEQSLAKQLDIYGRRVTMLHGESRTAFSQHHQDVQQVTASISALQSYEGESQIQSQHMSVQSRSGHRPRCRPLVEYKPYRYSRWYGDRRNSTTPRWNAATYTNRVVHSRDCSCPSEVRGAKQIGFRISYNGPLLQVTVKAAIAMTWGFSLGLISPLLTHNCFVPSNTGSFRVMNFDLHWKINAADLQQTLKLRTQELKRLYQSHKASPRDIDEDGNNIMHKACGVLSDYIIPYNTPMFDSNISNTLEMLFQFLRNLHDLGVPLNSVNAAGLTPHGRLVQEHIHFQVSNTLTTSLSNKLLDLGAELPLFVKQPIFGGEAVYATLGRRFAKCSDLAESFGCNEIAMAIQAKAHSWLKRAIHRNPECINQPNVLGQTPLHFSVDWLVGMRELLDAGADVDVFDDIGWNPAFYAVFERLHQPFEILAERNCILASTGTFSRSLLGIRFTTISRSLLEIGFAKNHRLNRDSCSTLGNIREDAREVERNTEATFKAITGVVVRRRRELEVLVRTFLDAQTVEQLRISPEKVLDYYSSRAIEMLKEKIDVPPWLDNLSPLNSTVYHDIENMTVQQASVFWDAGFHDVDELDSSGLSALMICAFRKYMESGLALAEWLVGKGADLYRRQKHAFRRGKMNGSIGKEIYKSDRASSLTAVHYLGACLSRMIFNPNGDTPAYMVHSALQNAGQLGKTVLINSLPDCCTCDCSLRGCSAFTMSLKRPLWMSTLRLVNLRQGQWQNTRVLAQLLDVDQPSLQWLRHEMIRFNTFTALNLHHTCCMVGQYRKGHTLATVIYEPYDDEEVFEIREEQAEQRAKLETLLVEFESKYEELGVSLSEFFDVYWKVRMDEVAREETPIDKDALKDMGVVLRRSSWASSNSTSSRTSSPESSETRRQIRETE